MSSEIAEYMTWHHLYDAVDGIMVHFFYGEVWKQFNNMHSQFSMKPQNIYLGLNIDEFNTFQSFIVFYFYWSVILTTYNLSLEIHVKLKFMFLYVIIHCPYIPGRNTLTIKLYVIVLIN